MAVCILNKETLNKTRTVVEKLVGFDEKYYDFDNTFEYIYDKYKNNPEGFTKIIVSMAVQYGQLASIVPKVKIGKALFVQNVNHTTTSIEDFVKEVYTLYGKSDKVRKDSGSELNKILNQIIAFENDQDIIGLIPSFVEALKYYIIDNKDIVTQDQINQVYFQYRDELIKLAKSLPRPMATFRSIDTHLPNNRDFLQEDVLTKIRSKNTDVSFSKYVDPVDIIQDMGYNLYITTNLQTGVVHHVYNDNGVYKDIQTNDVLDINSITAPTLALEQGGDSISFYVPTEMLTGGLTFVPLNKVNPSAINDLETNSELFKIRKIKNPSFGRINILNQEGFPKAHETFENNAQRNLLRNKPNSVVVNYMNSEDEFIIVAVHESGQVYELKSAKNLAVITETDIIPITSENVKQYNTSINKKYKTVKAGRTETVDNFLNDEDIRNLQDGINFHKELLLLRDTDLTDYFYNNFDLSAFLNETTISVSDYYENTPSAQFKVKTVELSTEEYINFQEDGSARQGILTGKEVKELTLPLLFYKPNVAMSYESTNTLPKNHVIVNKFDSSGKPVFGVMFEEYIHPVLNRVREIGDVHKSNVAVLVQALNNNTDISNLENYDLSDLTVRFLDRSRYTSDSKYFAGFINKIAIMQERSMNLTPGGVSSIEKELSNLFFTQKYQTERGLIFLIPNIGFDLSASKRPQIEINSRFPGLEDFVKKNKNFFRYKIDSLDPSLWSDVLLFMKFDNLVSMIQDKGMIEVIKQRVKKADLNKNLTGEEYAIQEEKKLNILFDVLYNNPIKVAGFTEIENGFRELEKRWGEVMFKAAKKTLDILKNNEEGLSEEALQILSTINPNDLFTREALLNGEVVHYPEVYPKSNDDRKKFYGNLDNYSIKERPSALSFAVQKQKSITRMTSEQSTTSEPIVIKSSGTKIKLKPGQAGKILSFKSQFTTEEAPERNDAIAWLHEALPQIGIAQEDVETLITLSAEDGVVLGAFHDRLIYLNNKIKGKGTVYHEAFHGVFRLLLSDQKRADLLKQIKSDKSNKKKFEAAYLREFAKKRSLVYEQSNIENLVAEEILADAFQDYMIRNKKSKQSWLQKVLDLLKTIMSKLYYRLTRDVKSEVFLDIRNGFYKKSSIESGLFEGQTVLELISGTQEVVISKGLPSIQMSYLSPREQKQIIQQLTHYLLNNRKLEKTFEENFESAAAEIAKLYDFNSIRSQPEVVRRYESMSQVDRDLYLKNIEEKHGPTFKNIHFILTAGTDKQDRSYVNKTGHSSSMLGIFPDYPDNPLTDFEIADTDENGNEINGLDSLQTLKTQVRDYLKNFVAYKEENVEEDVDELDDDESADFGADEEKEARKDPFDSNLFGINTLANVSAEFKRFFSMISYTEIDDLGISRSRMIDGQMIFNAFLKMSADVDADQILPTIQSKIEDMYYNGYVQEASDLQKAFDLFSQQTGLDENFVPAKGGNTKLYNEFIDTMYKTGIELVQLTKSTNTYTKIIAGVGSQEETSTSYYWKDSVLETDKKTKKDDLLRDFKVNYLKNIAKNNKDRDDFIINLQNASIAFTKIANKSNLGIFNDTQLEVEVEDANKHFINIGLKLPKSFIKLSLMAIEEKENKVILDKSRPSYQKYVQHKAIINSEQYLRKDFFKVLSQVLNELTKDLSSDQIDINIAKNNSSFKSFDFFLKKAATYLVLSDPTDLQSVVLNAEQKPIYRYSSYTPAMLIAKDIRINGFQESLMNTPYWKNFLSKWYADHPFVKILNGPITEERIKIETYLSNISISVNGGIIEIEDNIFKGQSFKSISMSNLYLTEILSFLTRKSVVSPKFIVNKGGEAIFPDITTYRRSLAQNEGSNTNFYVSSLYENYMNPSETTEPFTTKVFLKGAKSDLNKAPLIVSKMYDVVGQEYKRIQREHKLREENLRRKALGENTLVTNYNTFKDATDTFVDGVFVPNPLVTKNGRAFNFSIFGKMLSVTSYPTPKRDYDDTSQEKNSLEYEEMLSNIRNDKNLSNEDKNYLIRSIGIREQLREAAFQNIEFDKLKESLRYELSQLIFETLERQYRDHLEILEREGIIEGVDLSKPYKPFSGSYVHSGVDAQVIFTPELRDIKSFKYEGLVENNAQREIELANYYRTSSLHKGGQISTVGMMLRDKFYNYQYNNVTTGQLFNSGDKALSVKDSIDEIKRDKANVASGPSGKKGYYKQAVLKEVTVYIHPDQIELGQYDTLEEAEQRLLEKGFSSSQVSSLLSKFTKTPVMDGQAYNSMMHVIQLFESSGRMDTKSKNILIDANFRSLTDKEKKHLKNYRQVLNSKKTVHADLTTYLKHSEHTLLRAEVSYVDAINIRDAHSKLRKIYGEIYSLKTFQGQVYDENRYVGNYKADSRFNESEQRIQELYRQAHEFYKPLPGREALHSLLNKLEAQNIDYVSDTNASKKATFYPDDINDEVFLATSELDFKYKFMQIETSGIKEQAKASVQSKLLLPADKEFLRNQMLSQGINPIEIDESLEVFDEYNSSLAEVVKSKFEFFKKFIAKNDNVDIADLYNIIYKSLVDRDADANLIKLFEVKDGRPVHSPYLPLISDQLKYYFFSVFSNNLTEETVAGFKNFLVSSWGHKLVYAKIDIIDEFGNLLYPEGTIITRDLIIKNPSFYEDVRFGTRYPEVSIEIEDGKTTYWAETIIAEPSFNSEYERQFYMRNLNKHFATRIPTEDKRSMIAIKVVDFIDGAYMNSIIVPQWVHLLAGSDFDIDSLYGQSYAYYKSYDGTLRLYGDSINEKEKFVEYVQYVATHPDIKAEVKQYLEQHERSLDPNELSEEALDILQMMLGTDFKYLEADEMVKYSEAVALIDKLQSDFNIINSKYDSILMQIEEFDELYEESPIQATLTFDVEEIQKAKSQFSKQKRERQEILKKLKQLRGIETKGVYQKIMNAQRTALRVNALFKVLTNKGLPITLNQFIETNGQNLVTPAFQNKNLKAKLGILSSEKVYELLYSKQRSNVEELQDVAKVLDRPEAKIAGLYDINSPDGQIQAKYRFNSSDTGIGIAANINKALAAFVENGLVLSDKEVIWKLNGGIYNTFGGQDSETDRSIAKVGNALGMFADAIKTPLPAALLLNSVNTPITLTLIALGLPVQFSIFMNLIPEIRRSVEFVAKEERNGNRIYLSNVLQKEIEQIEESYLERSGGESLHRTFERLGLFKIKSNRLSDARFDMSKFNINYNKVTNVADVNNPTLMDLGISVTGLDNVEFGTEVQKVILLSLYKQQSSQFFNILTFGSIMDMFKKLKGDFKRFDKIKNTFALLRNNALIFKNSSVMFKEGKVWSEFEKIVDFIDKSSEDVAVSRIPMFKNLIDMMSSTIEDKEDLAKRIMSSMIIDKFVKEYRLEEANLPGDDVESLSIKNQAIQIRTDIQKFFRDYKVWFNVNDNVIERDLQFLYDQYKSTNAFVRFLVESKSKANIKVIEDGKFLTPDNAYKKHGLRFIQMSAKTKINNSTLSREVADGFEQLYYNADTKDIARRLLYQEIARSGMGRIKNSYISYINPDILFKEFSNIANLIGNKLKSIPQASETTRVAQAEKELKEIYNVTSRGAMLTLISEWLDIARYYNIKTQKGLRNVSWSFDLEGFTKQVLNGTPQEALNKMFDYEALTNIKNDKKSGKIISDSLIANSTTRNNARIFTIDLNDNSFVKMEGMEKVAMNIGASPVRDNNIVKGYTFPTIIDIRARDRAKGVKINIKDKNNYLKLVSIDDVSIEELMFRAMASGSGVEYLTGHKAVYAPIFTDTLPSGFEMGSIPPHILDKMTSIQKGFEDINLDDETRDNEQDDNLNCTVPF